MHQPDFEEVFGLNAAYAEKVYGDYLEAPDSVPAEWRNWFDKELPPEQRAVPKPNGGWWARRCSAPSPSAMSARR